ncbi:putative N-acetyltransferase YafP [Erwinia rhapontici]|uniref:GNAT family N-acetyltransferase n=1 Tax=Erwinia rhapontici TaxID=55212 RepID=UPI001BB41F1E|nr:GNAT family N-acetyltransferase [Erwinia rhapontici]BCQ39907.1 putative N-acetyltransferase YafP [Erwinia rhapontici]
MSITIRAFQASDLDAAITLFQGAVRQIASQDYNPEQIDAWVQVDRTAWEKRFKESQCWLAVRNGELAGFGNVEYDGHLDMLFTDPRHQRCGVATALLKWLELAVVKMDIPVIYTEASITAKPFFIRHGFQLVEAQQVSVRGQSFINYRLRKILM